ncbi:MAG: glycosyltransferase [Gemmatimonadota bacterium]|nr:MAG: glycosyltransferase [Gemmatimonadota bacterium]
MSPTYPGRPDPAGVTERVPFVSIVVPTRNRAPLLADCLRSLTAQSYPAARYEVIVVDDGSTDGTGELIREFAERREPPSIRCIKQNALGLNAARNAGLQAALGDPVVFVDDDVDAPAHWLNALAEGSLKYPEAGCLGGPIRLRLEGKTPRFCGSEPLGETELDHGEEEAPIRAVWGANMAVRKAAVRQVGPFNEDLKLYGDEEEWEMRLTASGGCVMYLPEAWLWHRRIQDDLRLRRMLRARLRRGRGHIRFGRTVGQDFQLRAELLELLAALAHTLRHWCAGGLLHASLRCGRILELLADRRPSRLGARPDEERERNG